jgi:hypothetical protein
MRTRIAISLALVLAWSTVAVVRAADEASPEPPADVTCTPDVRGGTWTAISEPSGTLLRISGSQYMGNASLAFKGGMAPTRLKFRFVNVRQLQTFTLSDGKHSYQANLGGLGQTVVRWNRLGQYVTDPAQAAVTMTVEGTKAGDIDVNVSTVRGVALSKELKVNWVQYFLRRRGKGG